MHRRVGAWIGVDKMRAPGLAVDHEVEPQEAGPAGRPRQGLRDLLDRGMFNRLAVRRGPAIFRVGPQRAIDHLAHLPPLLAQHQGVDRFPGNLLLQERGFIPHRQLLFRELAVIPFELFVVAAVDPTQRVVRHGQLEHQGKLQLGRTPGEVGQRFGNHRRWGRQVPPLADLGQARLVVQTPHHAEVGQQQPGVRVELVSELREQQRLLKRWQHQVVTGSPDFFEDQIEKPAGIGGDRGRAQPLPPAGNLPDRKPACVCHRQLDPPGFESLDESGGKKRRASRDQNSHAG